MNNKSIAHIQLDDIPKNIDDFDDGDIPKAKKVNNLFQENITSSDEGFGSYYVVRPLHLLSILFGVGRVRNRNLEVDPLPKASKVMSAIFAFSLFGFGVYHYLLLRESFAAKTVGRIYCKIYCTLNLAHTLLIVTAVVNTIASDESEYLKILRNIDFVDRKLPVMRKKLYKFLNMKHIALIALAILVAALLIWNDTKYFCYEIYPEFEYFLICLNIFLLLQFFVDVVSISLRISIVNHVIKKTISKNDPRICPLNNVVDLLSRIISIPSSNIKSYVTLTKSPSIREITWMYDKLLDCITMLDNIYGFQLLVQVAAIFVVTLQFIVGTILRIIEGAEMPTAYIYWSVHNAIFMLMMTSVCDTLYANVNKTSIILNNLLVSQNQDPLFRQHVTDFLRLLDSCLTTISACKCFPINFSLLMTFCGAVASHTIIFLQFMNI